MSLRALFRPVGMIAGLLAACCGMAQAAESPKEIRLDYAYYSPVSLVLKEKGLLEARLKEQGIAVRWVLSQGSNKALEYLNAESIDFGSTAGAAALLGKINGNPISGVYIYSKPEWTALVTKGDSPIKTVEDLKGKRVAVTRGTDPHIFLVRALAGAKLTQRDVKLVLLQHADGRAALEKGDVDAWAGLDPIMASAELDQGARLFYRNADANTYGLLNVRTSFAEAHPALVDAVIASYEDARRWALANPAELQAVVAGASKLTPEVAARQLTRTDLSNPAIGSGPQTAIEAAGKALQEAGVIEAKVDVTATVKALLDPRFTAKLAAVQ